MSAMEEEGRDYRHKACVKSLNMSQLGWQRSNQLCVPPSIGTLSSPRLALPKIPANYGGLVAL